MVDLLVGLHACKEFWLDVVVSPADVKIEIENRVGLHDPLVLLGYVLDRGILGFCMRRGVPATLMMILCFLPAIWFL